MVFASPVFLFAFLPVSVLLCGLAARLGKARLRNALLLLFSLIFYAWGEPVYVLLMLAAILVNYGLGRLVRRSRAAFAVSLIWNLGVLCAFKYLDLLLSGANAVFQVNLPMARLALPVGISFYTFQILSYIIDVRRGDVPAETNLVDFAAYVSMFPQLIAGPIVRYAEVRERLSRTDVSLLAAASGARRFCFGLAKKVLIANLVSQAADAAFDLAGGLCFVSAWTGAIAYAIQIFFDFSGYSDMAIGLGQMLGFSFPENFDRPYAARSVREFWRRWHISLSGWFRDYLYIPLGGSRKGRLRTFRNLLIVFTLCGLWHGAAWSFALWGLWHGLFLCLERIPAVKRTLKRLPSWVGWLYTALVVLLGWVLFRADSLGAAWRYFGDLFTVEGAWVTDVFNWYSAGALVLGALLCLPKPRIPQNAFTEALSTLAALALLAVCAVCLAGGTYNPFLYFRF